jgi:hypothetical protein
MSIVVEFVSERKVVMTYNSIPEAQIVKEKLIAIRNEWNKNEKLDLKWLWVKITYYMVADPFLPLTLRVKKDNVTVFSQLVWKNTTK